MSDDLTDSKKEEVGMNVMNKGFISFACLVVSLWLSACVTTSVAHAVDSVSTVGFVSGGERVVVTVTGGSVSSRSAGGETMVVTTGATAITTNRGTLEYEAGCFVISADVNVARCPVR